MSSRNFEMRLSCSYQDSKNTVVDLHSEVLQKGEWQAFELNANSPGFLIFVYALLGCQHLYFRSNCAERNLILESAQGVISIETSEDWDIHKLRVRFEGKLKSGQPEDADIDYIVARMKLCPVSKNVIEPQDSKTTVKLLG